MICKAYKRRKFHYDFSHTIQIKYVDAIAIFVKQSDLYRCFRQKN